MVNLGHHPHVHDNHRHHPHYHHHHLNNNSSTSNNNAFPPPPSPFTPRPVHQPLPHPPTLANTLGILTTNLLPSLTLHTSLSLISYSAGRFTDRLDAKDLLWPSALVGNAWYHGVVYPYLRGRNTTLWGVLKGMGYTQMLILGGVTIWGSRLFAMCFLRVKARGKDDGRYERHRRAAAAAAANKKGKKKAVPVILVEDVDGAEGSEAGEGKIEAARKKRQAKGQSKFWGKRKGEDTSKAADGSDEGKEGDQVADEQKADAGEMWNKAFLNIFLPEAIIQSLVGLGWSVLRYSRPVVAIAAKSETILAYATGFPTGWRRYLHSAAIATFTAGMALEILADSQLSKGKKKLKDEGLVMTGTWSIVRHPNYLGNFLVNLSFPLLSLADGIFNPVMLIGPISDYIFLRRVGGDKENEEYQAEKYQKESPRKHAELLAWKEKKNSFWPGLMELGNPSTWVVVGIASAVAVGEKLAVDRWQLA